MDYDPRDRQVTWRDVCAGAVLCLSIGVAVFVPGSWRSATGPALAALPVMWSPGPFALLSHVDAPRCANHLQGAPRANEGFPQRGPTHVEA